MALLLGSSAIDTGATGEGIPATDQRGVARRPQGAGIDIGAYEYKGTSTAWRRRRRRRWRPPLHRGLSKR
ncbi:MAG: choice-of-anchor Q domain-containing protein [Actinomycetota bacterium]|nr:choice-of-anchor Q domain-containing protein [Actinomycetota bacterium]